MSFGDSIRQFALATLFAYYCTGVETAEAQARVALVIGNDAYPNLGQDKQLKKAVNDARAIGDALERIGFDVIRGENLGRQAMADRVFDFTQRIGLGDIAVVFYAGHGVALGGGNYMLPSDVLPANPGEEARVRNMAIGEADILADLQERKAGVSIVILDACRDNPFRQPGMTRSAGQSRGLTRASEAQGVFAIYSAGFGQTALDNLGANDASNNSVFTRILAPALGNPGVHLADLMIDVRQEVARLAQSVGHQQDPAYYDQARGGRIYLATETGGDATGNAPGMAKPKEVKTVAPPVPAVAPADRRGSVGRVWYLKEHTNWQTIWTRRGTSDTFDAIGGPDFDFGAGLVPGQFAWLSTVEMEIEDRKIVVRQRYPRSACIYEGALGVDGETASGTYECNNVTGVYKWSAEISDRLPDSPGDDWRGQVWNSTEGGAWEGVWKRRGVSSIFDAEWRYPPEGGYETALIYIRVTDNEVIAYRDQEKGQCTYRGKRQADRRTIVGGVECTWASAEWRAEIVD